MSKTQYKKQLEKVLRLIIDNNIAAPHSISEAADKILDADREFEKLKRMK